MKQILSLAELENSTNKTLYFTFDNKIEGIDCIAMGPALYDVHTVKERASISSVERTFKLLLEILKKCK